MTLVINLILIVLIIIAIIIAKFMKAKRENPEKFQSESSFSLRMVCLLIPLVGLIVYAVNIVQTPKIAKECGKWALIGFCIGIVLSLISMCIVMLG